jgi:beta-glucanase (GH16 family)
LALLLAGALLGLGALNLSCGGGGGSSSNAAVQATAPVITTEPASQQTLNVGQTATFTVVATGTAPLQYQWYKGTTAVGTDSATFTIPSVQSTDSGTYTVTVSSGGLSVTSTPAALTVNTAQGAAPVITTQPASQQTLNVGQTATFTVVATGTAPLQYQWYKGTTAVGTNSATFTIPSVQTTDAGSYLVTVSSGLLTVTSSPAVLTVNAVVTPPTSVNLALGKTPTASSMGSATQGPGLVTDGNVSTAWSSAPVDPSWIYIDLGTAQSFNRVVLNWGAGYGTVYTIDVSNDANAWSTVYTKSAGTGGVEDDSFPMATGRYVRMNGTARGNSNGYVLAEMAVYDSAPVSITASAGSNGSISPSGTVSLIQGDTQVFTITPDAAFLVADVQVDGTSVGPVTTYTFSNITVSHTISATFKVLIDYPITATAGANGSISPAGAVEVLQGANQAYTITPATGYTVKDVLVDGVSAGPVTTYTFTNVQAPHSISVSFGVPATYLINATTDPNGIISPGGAVTVTQGLSQSFIMTPNAGFTVATVTVDGVLAGSMSRYTFTNLQGPHTIAVTFGPSGGMVWNDEFDGPVLDTTKWAFDLGNGPTSPTPLYGWGNGEMEYYTSSADNADIENGNLVITARRQDWGTQPFTSARLVTRGKFSFNHGKFDASIKMPQGDRMWPAFWLLGDTGEAWPMCGEIDIAEMFCGAVGRGDNVEFSTAHWWDENLSQHLLNSGIWTNPTNLSDDYHLYELEWDDQYLRGRIDGTEFWSMDITDPTMSELKNHDFYIILNLAVGSPNFGMTSASQADGPLPQKMYVDYVRVYSNTGSTVVDEVAAQPHGTLGILPDGAPTDSQLQQGTDLNLFLWNNLTAVTGTPAGSVTVKTTDNTWFGFGYNAGKRLNLMNYAAGYLHVSIKTTSTDSFQVGISGGNDGNAWVSFVNGSDPYGFKRDGQWHSVAIPMTLLNNADFSDIVQFFMVAGTDTVTPGSVFSFDQIYWSENAAENMAAPVGTRYGIYTERVCDAGSFNPATDGSIDVWNPTNFNETTGVPFEGASSFAFSAPAAAWWGVAIAPSKLYDLSAFKNGHMHVALKVPATTTTDFKIGLKSPGGTAVRESWLKFKNGADPYGLVRDGQYHELLIPMTDFCNSDLAAVAQLFMLAGDLGPAAMEFDDVYLTAN